MQDSMSRYPVSESIRRAAFCLFTFFLGIQPGFADLLDFSSDDTLTITADRAWEGDRADVTHLNFRSLMRLMETGDTDRPIIQSLS